MLRTKICVIDIGHDTTDEGLSYGPYTISESTIFTACDSRYSMVCAVDVLCQRLHYGMKRQRRENECEGYNCGNCTALAP